MKKNIIPLLVVSTAMLAGCNNDHSTTSSPAISSTTTSAPVVQKADAIAEVNGQYIPKSALTDLEKEIATRGQGQTFPKDKLVEELVQRELLIQDAMKKQLDKTPEVIAQLENAKDTLLTQADLMDFLKKNPITDAEIKAEYDSKVGGQNGMEYKARHILVKTEDEAKAIIAALAKGADFAKLANKDSLDAKESQNGGELGWFNPKQMVPAFSKAVADMKNGETTKTPIQTQFGWHVIQKEDSRTQTPPPLDSVKEQLMPYLQRKKVQAMVKTLREQAKVEVLIPLTEETKPVVPAPVSETKALPPAIGKAAPAVAPAPEVAPATKK
jgi:peptidyl-prolyl cis-trans isomerase C